MTVNDSPWISGIIGPVSGNCFIKVLADHEVIPPPLHVEVVTIAIPSHGSSRMRNIVHLNIQRSYAVVKRLLCDDELVL